MEENKEKDTRGRFCSVLERRTEGKECFIAGKELEGYVEKTGKISNRIIRIKNNKTSIKNYKL